LDWAKGNYLLACVEQNPNIKIISLQHQIGIYSDATFSRLVNRIFGMTASQLKAKPMQARKRLHRKYAAVYNHLPIKNNEVKK
jgi:hypothetical protein